MKSTHEMTRAADEHNKALPGVRRIGISDLSQALWLGVEDYKRFWVNSVFLLCLLVPLAIAIVAIVASSSRFIHLILPVMSGLSLVAPTVAVVFYLQSRWRERGAGSEAERGYGINARAVPRVAILATLLYAVMAAWLLVADGLYQSSFDGVVALSLAQLWDQVFATEAGAKMVLIGVVVGFFFAALVFCLSVTSFPMLIDRDVGVSEAMATSIKVVIENPKVMAYWAIFIAGSLFLASVPLLLGLAIVLPVLGHASWHLYRRAVVADAG